MKYYRTNDKTQVQQFYILDKINNVIKMHPGIAAFLELAKTQEIRGKNLLKVDGYEYDRATQAFLKQRSK